MAITTLGLTGFEHGFIGAGAQNGGGLFDTTPGAGWSASTSSPRNGSYCAHLVAPAATATALTSNFAVAQSKPVIRFGVKVTTRPSSGTAMLISFSTVGSEACSVLVSSTGVLSARLAGGTTATGPTIDTTSWHLIELQVDFTGHTLDWKVDGVLQTRATGGTTSTTATLSLGVLVGTGQPAYTADFDDLIVGTWITAAIDWYGDGKVLAQLPGSDGTHATITSLSPGDAATAYSGTVTNAYTQVDDPPGTGGWTTTRATTDNLALRTATVGAYAEIKPAVTAETGQANAVKAIMSYSSSATQANLAACDVRNSANVVTALWGLTGGVGQAYNVTANNFKGAIITRPAAGWTAAEVNAIRFRFGGCTSADISPVPTVQAVMLEVDWPSAVPPPLYETLIDDFNRADDYVDAGAGAAIWNRGRFSNSTFDREMVTTANTLGSLATASAYTKIALDNSIGNVDMLVDCVAVGVSTFHILLTGAPGPYSSYALSINTTTFQFVRYVNSLPTVLQTVNLALLTAGDTYWIRKRGSQFDVFRRPSGGVFGVVPLISVADSVHNPPSGVVGVIVTSGPGARWDNLRGGPFGPKMAVSPSSLTFDYAIAS